MVAKDLTDGTITTSEINAKAQAYFTALYTNKDRHIGSPINATYTPINGIEIRNHPDHRLRHHEDRLHEGRRLPEPQLQRPVPPRPGAIRACGSRWCWITPGRWTTNGKMAALQKAATDMIDTLSSYNKQTGDVYISIIPFAKDVNVGTSNVDASWINWTDWEAEPPFLSRQQVQQFQHRPVGRIRYCPVHEAAITGFTCMDRPATVSGSRQPAQVRSQFERHLCTATSAPASTAAINVPAKPGFTTMDATRPSTGATASCGHCASNPSARAREAASSKDLSPSGAGDGTAATAAAAPGHEHLDWLCQRSRSGLRHQERRTGISSQPVHEVLRRTVGGLPSRHGDADEQ